MRLISLTERIIFMSDTNITISNLPSQTTDTLLMVRPVDFAYNEETAKNNAFQSESKDCNVQELARIESDNYINLLEDNGIKVVPITDTKNPFTPDSIFPNNGFSTHENGVVVFYPMFAQDRRDERKPKLFNAIKNHFEIDTIVDLTQYEPDGLFLEGTGSMVLDRINKIAYACRSPRTSEVVLKDFCKQLGFDYLLFDSLDEKGVQIYHTNVMMSVGTELAVVCLDSIKDAKEKKALINSLTDTGRKIVDISYDQLNHFAGNMLEVKNKKGDPFLIMSRTAFESLTKEQIMTLSSKLTLLTPKVSTIEKNGGGSARCMIAEIFRNKECPSK